MADVTIKQGDRLPVLARQFLTDGSGTNLTGATVTFDMWNAATGTQVITAGSCTVITAASGEVEYPWSATDATLPAGVYLGAFTATFSGPRILTAPNNGMIAIEIVAETGSVWSYTGNPAARVIDKVRFLIGDTDSLNKLLTDSELSFLLSEWNNDPYLAGAYACESLASKYAAKSDSQKSVGDLSLSTQYGEQAARFQQQANRLRNQSVGANPPTPRVYKDVDSNVFGEAHFAVGMDKNGLM